MVPQKWVTFKVNITLLFRMQMVQIIKLMTSCEPVFASHNCITIQVMSRRSRAMKKTPISTLRRRFMDYISVRVPP